LAVDGLKSGVLGKPIVIRPETLHGVKFTGGSRISLKANYVEVREFTFENNLVGYNIEVQDGFHHNRITQNYFVGCGNKSSPGGIVILASEGANHNRVDHNFLDQSQSKSLVLAASKLRKAWSRTTTEWITMFSGYACDD